MDGKTPPVPFEPVFKVPSKVWKKKYKCKKNKGDHTFEIAVIRFAGWQQEKDGTWKHPTEWSIRGFIKKQRELPYWVEWHCNACKKHAYELGNLDRKFDIFRPYGPTQTIS